MSTVNNYLNNPLIHSDRRLANMPSEWVRSFSCMDMRPLIICRGPIRKEVMDVFTEMGISGYGILLSEKDSIVYPNALSPELRLLTDPNRIHRVPDYSGATKEERLERIEQIIKIAKQNNYNAIFAGYGFMAEDEDMVAAVERAGLNFIGPCARTVHSAGLKDEAKRTALKVGVSVTPGIDNATTLVLLAKYPDVASLELLVKTENLKLDKSVFEDPEASLADKAACVLAASYDAGIDLYSIEELQAQIEQSVIDMVANYPDNRIRLKAIGGGGGKGQRILAASSSYSGSKEQQAITAASKAPALVLEILNEVKTTGVGDNKNILLELNIESTRHQEIQVLGNGDWCISLGARDCSLQMHEQKLLEVSSTHESLAWSITCAKKSLGDGNGSEAALRTLEADLKILDAMELEAATFGQAVGLDSVSTFECIVDAGNHFFMEMNTRIQVEHRVTELCYSLKFSNPDNKNEVFIVDSLVEAMVLLARHGSRLPKPGRIVRKNASIEARLNATNEALQPHAGGLIGSWSEPMDHEIRDDQGISLHNPDTNVFMKYNLAGAYDSNIALLLTHGEDRLDSFERLAEILRCTDLQGEDLCTNLEFHYGLTNWFIGNHVQARPTTQFIVPYLTAVGLLKQEASNIDLPYAYQLIRQSYLNASAADADLLASKADVIDRKQSLLLRPLDKLLNNAHALSGWLSIHSADCSIVNNGSKTSVVWHCNPILLLDDLYHYLNMDYRDDRPAQDIIWDHDYKILVDALQFYQSLDSTIQAESFADLSLILSYSSAPNASAFNSEQWLAIQSAHQGYQAGLSILAILPYIAAKTDFYDLFVNDDLSIHIPERLFDEALQIAMQTALVPPLAAKSDEILAASGGMFYSRETPTAHCFVSEGDHFEIGDDLYIVEVMKMFNKVTATFAGTVDKILVADDGVIISKGQPLFKVTPDEHVVIESPETLANRKRASTNAFVNIINQT